MKIARLTVAAGVAAAMTACTATVPLQEDASAAPVTSAQAQNPSAQPSAGFIIPLILLVLVAAAVTNDSDYSYPGANEYPS
jgi:hypothetical protein